MIAHPKSGYTNFSHPPYDTDLRWYNFWELIGTVQGRRHACTVRRRLYRSASSQLCLGDSIHSHSPIPVKRRPAVVFCPCVRSF
jgi:hypothetical protein